jgi:hypothetical protein
MSRKLNRRQRQQNAAFLEALSRTGNTRLAARELGVNRSTYTKRRAKHATFAAEWEAALEAADAAILPSRKREGPGEGLSKDFRTKDGEPTVTRLAKGRLQLRRAPPGRVTKAAEQAFLATLGETANIRLAAAEAGFAHTSFLARARRDPAFAREMRTLIAIAADRLVWARCEGALSPVTDYDFDPDIPIPRMSVEQAILQLTYHRPDGPFQMSRRATPPPSLEKVAPRILAKVRAIKRHSHFVKTGRWRYAEELVSSAADAERPRAANEDAEGRPARRET